MEEAIKRLKQGMNSMAGEFVECWFRKEHLRLAIDAMEKQIPMNTTRQNKSKEVIGMGLCPRCEEIVTERANYCYKCGQRLDWGNENGK